MDQGQIKEILKIISSNLHFIVNKNLETFEEKVEILALAIEKRYKF